MSEWKVFPINLWQSDGLVSFIGEQLFFVGRAREDGGIDMWSDNGFPVWYTTVEAAESRALMVNAEEMS